MTDRTTITKAAHDYLSAGLCALPARRAEKRPAVGLWKRYQKRLPTEAELSAWFANGPDAVCIVCGEASNNLEMIDFDAGGELFEAWSKSIPRTLMDKLVVETTQSGGWHIVYRSKDLVCGSLKLAQRKHFTPNGDDVVIHGKRYAPRQDADGNWYVLLTLIETRGEGGLFLCAPTADYEIVQGDMCDLPVLSEAERDVLMQAAWELNEYRPPVVDGPQGSANVGHNRPSPADSSHSSGCLATSADKSHNGSISAGKSHCGQRRPHNGQCSRTSANVSHIGSTPAENSDTIRGSQASVNVSHPGQSPADNSDTGECSPTSTDISDIGKCSQTPADISHHGQLSAEKSDSGHCPPTSAENSHIDRCPPENADRPGDDFNRRGDVRSILNDCGWVLAKPGENEYWRRPGKANGTSATLKDRVFYVFSSNAAPFEPNQAYSPFAVYTLLTCDGDFEQAARSLRERGFGGDGSTDNATGVDISAICRMSAPSVACPSDNGDDGPSLADPSNSRPTASNIADPGPIPKRLFNVPGFVATVCDFTLARAPYPNLGLAFCGALALQSYLCARKVCTTGDLRPNIYLLALASSGTGKDFPRKVNSRVLFEIGRVAALGDKFASGEGIQDALVRSSAMLFQNDEMDGVLRQINLDRENKRESIPNILLTLYTSAGDIYPIRVKAGQKEAAHIDQPHLTLFGTATPKAFYESLSQRMLTNGLFARMMIVDIGKRGRGQTPGSARDLPDGILQQARWWDEFCPGQRKRGNLYEVHPEPQIVPFTPEAEQAVERLQRMGEDEYDLAHAANDEVGKAAWSRTCENAKKLALLYACSENHEDPVIGPPAVEWATDFAMHQTRRQLYLAATYVAENPFHAECLKLTRKLKDAGGQMARRQIMRAMRCKAADFDQIISTLLQQGDIVAVDIPSRTRPAQGYQLA